MKMRRVALLIGVLVVGAWSCRLSQSSRLKEQVELEALPEEVVSNILIPEDGAGEIGANVTIYNPWRYQFWDNSGGTGQPVMSCPSPSCNAPLISRELDFNWGNGLPVINGVAMVNSADNFYGKFYKEIYVSRAGQYYFRRIRLSSG